MSRLRRVWYVYLIRIHSVFRLLFALKLQSTLFRAVLVGCGRHWSKWIPFRERASNVEHILQSLDLTCPNASHSSCCHA